MIRFFPSDPPPQIVLEGLPRTDERRFYGGYFAVEDIYFRQAIDCNGRCTFDGGLCSWNNDAGTDIDEFDWSLVSPLAHPPSHPLNQPPLTSSAPTTGTRKRERADGPPPRQNERRIRREKRRIRLHQRFVPPETGRQSQTG